MHGRLAPARSHHHVGVLWRPDRARLLAWQDYSHWSALHHALGVAILDLGAGGPWRVAAVHLNPADPTARYIEAGLIASAGLGEPWRPTLLGGDFNAAGAEPALGSAGDERGDERGFYDPEPYREQPRQPHQQHQVSRADDPAAPPRLDRRALERLRRAGLVDVAWHLRVPWAPTTGYHSDPHGDRRGRRRGRGRPDGWRASAAALPHITDYRVEEDIGSDHRPVTITLDIPENLRSRCRPRRSRSPGGRPDERLVVIRSELGHPNRLHPAAATLVVECVACRHRDRAVRVRRHARGRVPGDEPSDQAGRTARPTPGGAAMITWGRPRVVRIVVTAIGADGEKRCWYGDLRTGRDEAETIKLPDGTQAVTIERPVRVRVMLGQHRDRRQALRPVARGKGLPYEELDLGYERVLQVQEEASA
jgi:hypothetical protein